MLRAQIGHAGQRLNTGGERLSLSARALLQRRRDRFAGLATRLTASKLANAQAQRNAIARERERAQRLAERARRALATAMQRHDARVGHAGQLLTALSYRGVEMCYAIQAGRELRVLTKADLVSDLDAHQLAKDITKRIEAEMQYPGHIKVVVIRETRAVEVAK